MSEGVTVLSIGDIANMIMAAATVLGLVYIAKQTRDTQKHALGQTLFQLDSQFREFSDIHSRLMSTIDDYGPLAYPEDFLGIWSYMGLFERCMVLIEHGLLDFKTFFAFYGYRLYSVVRNYDIRTDIELNPEQHQYFIRLCHAVLAYKSHRGLNEADQAFAEHIKNFKLLSEPVVDWRVPHEVDTKWRTM